MKAKNLVAAIVIAVVVLIAVGRKITYASSFWTKI